MLSDFFIKALLAGTGLALIAGPLGCFVVWRRLAYFGDALAHAALIGVALGLILEIETVLSVFVVAAAISIVLVTIEKRVKLSSDSILGILSHTALALGLLILAIFVPTRVDLLSLLFGDILSVSFFDVGVIGLVAAACLTVLILVWRPLFAATVNAELATAEGLPVARLEILLMLMLALVVALAMKIVGVLLITALLIVPAAAARQIAYGPEVMAAIAAVIGVLSVVGGLFGSLWVDAPPGPAIVVVSAIFFSICAVLAFGLNLQRNRILLHDHVDAEKGSK